MKLRPQIHLTCSAWKIVKESQSDARICEAQPQVFSAANIRSHARQAAGLLETLQISRNNEH